jgi:hypothetical protein
VNLLIMLAGLAAQACMANELLWNHLDTAAGLGDVRAATVEVAGSPPTRTLTLRATGGERYAWVSIPPPAGGWDLTTRRAVEAVLTNVGEDSVEAMLWAVADRGWESIADIAVLERIGRPMALRQATAERGGSRGATSGVGRAGCGPIVEVPRSVLSTLKVEFFSSAQARLETALFAGRRHSGMECRQRLWISMSGSSSGGGSSVSPRCARG